MEHRQAVEAQNSHSRDSHTERADKTTDHADHTRVQFDDHGCRKKDSNHHAYRQCTEHTSKHLDAPQRVLGKIGCYTKHEADTHAVGKRGAHIDEPVFVGYQHTNIFEDIPFFCIILRFSTGGFALCGKDLFHDVGGFIALGFAHGLHGCSGADNLTHQCVCEHCQ